VPPLTLKSAVFYVVSSAVHGDTSATAAMVIPTGTTMATTVIIPFSLKDLQHRPRL
jgi:hypothetical protein